MMWHESVALGLAYDSNVPVTARIPQARVEVRPIRSEDVPAFTSLPPATSPRAEALTRINARHLLESGLQTCYVGVTEAGPVYMQFLVTPDQNERLRQVFRGLFPPLADDEGLLEFAFTLQEHRAPPVMPAVLLRLIEISAQRGLARVVAYVHMENQILLRFFLRIGFEPFTVRTERWRLFQRRVEFRPLQHDVSERLAARGGLASPGDVKAGQLPGAASPSADE
jgi:ribosomal protein S18 acetylase RimI-like enzyme